MTESGRTCQRWDAQVPHTHTQCSQRDCSADENHCRNPDGRALGAWCYTTDPTTRFEKCDLGPPSSPLLCNSIVLRPEAQTVFANAISQHVAAVTGLSASQVKVRVLNVREFAGTGRRRLQSQMLGTLWPQHVLCTVRNRLDDRASCAVATELFFSVEAGVDCENVMTTPDFHGVLADSASECPQ